MMAEETSSIFNKKAAAKLRNPDDLERYIQVTNPSVWAALAACAALLVGLLAWGVFGSVTTRVETMGAVIDGQPVCYLAANDAAKVKAGNEAVFGGKDMEVAEVAAVPLSRDETHDELGDDYLESALVSSDWTYRVTFKGDTSDLVQHIPQPASITIERIAPLSLVLKNWG